MSNTSVGIVLERLSLIIKAGSGRSRSNVYVEIGAVDVSSDNSERGLCLLSDNKMTKEQQEIVFDIICKCFDKEII